MQTNTVTAPNTPKLVKSAGSMLDTQQVANLIGRNWQFVNRQRHAGKFIDPDAVLKTTGAYLYKFSRIKKWAKENGYSLAA